MPAAIPNPERIQATTRVRTLSKETETEAETEGKQRDRSPASYAADSSARQARTSIRQKYSTKHPDPAPTIPTGSHLRRRSRKGQAGRSFAAPLTPVVVWFPPSSSQSADRMPFSSRRVRHSKSCFRACEWADGSRGGAGIWWSCSERLPHF